MAKKGHKPKEIVAKPRRVDVLVSLGRSVADTAEPGLLKKARSGPGLDRREAAARAKSCCVESDRDWERLGAV